MGKYLLFPNMKENTRLIIQIGFLIGSIVFLSIATWGMIFK